jgi:plastocyanin
MPGIRSAWLPALCLATLTCIASGQDVKGATGAINSTTISVEEGEITVHTIEVSNTTHYFTPNSINALPGDIVTFKFWPGNHSVIRADYGYPCIPYEDVEENGEGGFYSGVMSPDAQDIADDNVRDPAAYAMQVATNKIQLPTWNLTINSTAPTFFYCGAPGSCVNWAMLGAINADANHSIETQIKLARVRQLQQLSLARRSRY